jgi:hypothetical protein
MKGNTVRFGLRISSLRKRIAARTSPKRTIRQRLGLRAPRGWGWATNPRRALYNRVYNRTTFGCAAPAVLGLVILPLCVIPVVLSLIF